MIKVEKATPSMFEEVHDLLGCLMQGNSKLTKEHWRRLFEYTWTVKEDTRGFVLLDDDQIVGFVALILCERTINGEKFQIANSSSWCVLPEYRSSSLLLESPYFDLMEEGLTITAFTPNLALRSYHELVGFTELETHMTVLLPIPDPSRLPGLWKWSVTRDPEIFVPLLGADERKIYEDHQTLPCQHLVVWQGEEYCYIVHTKTEGPRGLSTSLIHHISDLPVFLQALEKIKLALHYYNKSVFVTIQKRMLRGNKLRFSRQVPIKNPFLIYSNTLKAEQVDSLYSEMVLLEI